MNKIDLILLEDWGFNSNPCLINEKNGIILQLGGNKNNWGVIIPKELVDEFHPLQESGVMRYQNLCKKSALDLCVEYSFGKENKEFIPVSFSREELKGKAYEVYEKAKSFKFYKKKGDNDNFYAKIFKREKISEIGNIIDVVLWLESWIDENGVPCVSKKELKHAYKEEYK